MAPYVLIIPPRNGLVILSPLQVTYMGTPFNEGSLSGASLSNLATSYLGSPFNSWSGI